jgi:hypothetical protein
MVIVVGCPADFIAICQDAGVRHGVAVRACDLRSIREVTATSQAFAVIVTEDLYQFDPEVFDAVVRQGAASLMRIGIEEAEDDGARRLLVEAIFESAATGPGSGVRPLRS